MFNKLIEWSIDQYHYLPWRVERSLYRTLVSEIMLQQTTVSTVLNHFEKFIKKFPDIESLAVASEEELLIAWKGLGYYRRARNLKKIAEQIQLVYEGNIPTTFEELIELNGIGAYTANALLAIGHNRKALAVDANLERVLSRVYGINEMKGSQLTKIIYQLFEEKKILHESKIKSYRALNEAIMDLGRINCRSKSVNCINCPLSKICQAHIRKEELKYPLLASKVKEKHQLHLLRIVIEDKKNFLVYKKKAGQWLEGQWELPTFILRSSDKQLLQYPNITILNLKFDESKLKQVTTSITKYAILNSILVLDKSNLKKLKLGKEYCWRKSDSDNNLSTATIKCLKKIELF